MFQYEGLTDTEVYCSYFRTSGTQVRYHTSVMNDFNGCLSTFSGSGDFPCLLDEQISYILYTCTDMVCNIFILLPIFYISLISKSGYI